MKSSPWDSISTGRKRKANRLSEPSSRAAQCHTAKSTIPTINIFGRRIHLRSINDKNFSIRSFQERAAINAPIQGSAADIIRLAMIEIDRLTEKEKKLNAKMLLQIHDELVFESSMKDQKNNEKLIKRVMTSVSSSEHHMFSIPLEVSINSGYNWGEAH